MRSSIACDKCRKSKTKCENSGINTVCKTCASTKRECIYGPSIGTSSGGSLRRESMATDGDVSEETSAMFPYYFALSSLSVVFLRARVSHDATVVVTAPSISVMPFALREPQGAKASQVSRAAKTTPFLNPYDFDSLDSCPTLQNELGCLLCLYRIHPASGENLLLPNYNQRRA
ncbi:hypothetical protein BKA66DRAFT_61508 [Pyrenochaeta sp. MPI-SDFR-AT-0127]|nr:hypothetical protein BKA66DRAFT_61508 [Pyrenochaeta sp. MPI-SDFR-AT-0127]